MRHFLFCLLLIISGCATKKICINQLENNRSIYDVENSCRLRIRQVVIGTDAEIPKSIDFKSGALWSYGWQESKFENGKLSSGHFVLTPNANQTSKATNGN
ncbi:MAG: hypothetical protein KDD45_14315 [Bdellovibrionales bacterium]|nr:hypothetical protein [Bdellovibrionales bacterium]